MDFVHLNVYSGYSFLKSGLTIRRLVSHALKTREKYVCVADIAMMRGAPEMQEFCKGRDIIPLYGVSFLLEAGKFVCYIKNEIGYRNALLLIDKENEGGYSLDFFLKHLEGIVCLLDASSYPFKKMIEERAADLPHYLKRFSFLGEDFYIGLPRNSIEPNIVSSLRHFAKTYPYQLIALPFVAYEKEEDAITVSILEAIDQGATLDQKSLRGQNHFLSDQEIASSFREEEIQATLEVAKKCSSFAYAQKRGGLAKFPLPKGEESASSYLRKLAYEGLKKRKPDYDERYTDRLEHELQVISSMGYDDYFLIVGDYVSFAKSRGILVGPGRGSGAGSLVSYCLDIVKPDPIQYGLLFERFLNPERQEMPDIDIDFEDTHRELVIRYLEEKYGRDHVAHIMTTQTLGAKQSLLDVGRVFGYKPSDIRLLSSRLDPRMSLAQNARHNFEFAKFINTDDYYKEIISLAFRIEGLPRQAGLHAAGIVLNDESLPLVAPISYNDTYGPTVQLDKDYLQDQGFLKFDLLGLTNLSLISHCLDKIESSRGIRLDYEDLPYEDPEAISLIASGKTMGLFQLESGGMNRAIAEIHPTTFEDVAAVIALFRPGPMANIPVYARRKQGLEKVTYLCKELEPILSSTYGVIVYQEQIMMIARELASFTYGQADIFRRAISRKNLQELSSLKASFLEGCLKNGHDEALANKLYDLIEKFADYGFNKSHAISYAILSCQMAYLKAHYPLEFYSALLDYGGGGKDKLDRVLSEIKKSRIPFYLPDVNASSFGFAPEKEGIRFPLSSISGLPGHLMEAIVDERKKNGRYKDLFSFALRLSHQGLTLEALIKLINAGAFDSLDGRRASLRLTAPNALRYGELFGGEGNLLSGFEPEPPVMEILEDNRLENLMLEKEALGIMISGSPLSAFEDSIKKKGLHPLSDLYETEAILEVAGILTRYKVINTKRGTKMCFLNVEDGLSIVEFTCFEETYNAAFPYLKEGAPLQIRGQKDRRREGGFLALSISPLGGNS